MSKDLERDVRLLKRYAVLSTIAFGAIAVAAFSGGGNAKFQVIDVERINVVEPDGRYRMVISNRPQSIGPIYKGKPFGYPGGGRPGMIFFNDEGTENGGFTFEGSMDSSGRYRASTHLSFDQFNQDQVLNLDYSDNNGRRLIGMSILDRTSADIYDLVRERDSIRQIPDSAARAEALRLWGAPRNGEPLSAQRLFVGRDRARSAIVNLHDPAGRVRLRLLVDSLGAARIEFLDSAGAVTSTLPSR